MPSMYLFGFGASTLPSQNCESILQHESVMHGCRTVENILNIIAVVFVAGKDLHKVVEGVRAWKSSTDLGVETDEFGPRHDRDFTLRTCSRIDWRAGRAGSFGIRDNEGEKPKDVLLDGAWRDPIGIRLKELGCY